MTIQSGANLYTQGFGSRPENVEIPTIDIRNPATTDVNYPIGKQWINRITNAVYQLTSITSAAGILSANWASLGTVGGDLDTLSGDTGTATPAAGDILLAGTAGEIVTSAAGNTITFALDDPLVISGALTVIGLFTADASAVIDTAGTALNLATDVDTAAVNIGTAAAARTITIGNVTGATGVVVNTGTGSFTATTTGTGDIVLNSDDTMLLDADGVLELNSSAGVIGIGNDADAQNINVGTGAAARVITVGNVTGATQVVLNSGTAGIAGTATNGAITFNSGTGAVSVSTDATATTVNLSTGAGVKTTTLGSTNTTSATTVQSGSGALNVTSANGALTVNSGTGALGISTDAAATTLSIGTGAAAKTLTIGSTNTTSATNLTAGSGGVNCATSFALTSVATFISLNGGAVTDFIGTGTLTAGTVTIANTNIAAADRIMLSRTAANASTALGMLTYTISAGASFTVTALETATPADTEVGDASSFSYIIFRQT